jgi:hypothetical protein
MKLLKTLIPTTIMAFAITACGGGPDVDQVRADFDNPSGSTKDKNGVIAASGKHEAAGNNSALSLAGAGVPGLGLTATTQKGFEKVGPMRFIAPHLRALGMKSQALTIAQDEGDLFSGDCIDNPEEFAEQLAEAEVSDDGSEVELSFEISVSDASKCSANLSGSFSIAYDIKVTQGSYSVEAEATYDNMCDSDSKSCLDGAMVIAGSFEGTTSEMLMAWDLTSQFTDEDGKEQAVATKGGIRMRNTATEASVEILLYVNLDGEEYSYVLKVAADVNGNSSFEFRGSDGEAICSFSESTGAAMCSGVDADGVAFDYSWSEEEYDSVTESDEFLDG